MGELRRGLLALTQSKLVVKYVGPSVRRGRLAGLAPTSISFMLPAPSRAHPTLFPRWSTVADAKVLGCPVVARRSFEDGREPEYP
jgi:hypothetical protein